MTNIKKIILTLIIAVVLVVVSSFSLKSVMNIFASDNSSNPENNSSYEYILKTHNGKVCVYDAKNNTLEKVYNIYVNTLPQQDIDALNKGIKIKDNQELKLYIQDFDS